MCIRDSLIVLGGVDPTLRGDGVGAAGGILGVRVPIVIRMEGTNVELGKQMLKDSGLNFTTADAMDVAAAKVVQLASAN